MKIYKVTYYDGHKQDVMFVKAKSINEAISEVKLTMRHFNIAGVTILSAERARLSSQVSCAAYTKRHPISEPKQIVRLMKGK